ncbi:MAG TPA: Bro-N domain-containing protein [Vampirovibrionales bacterium]
MTNLSVFTFQTQQVRVVTIEGEPWFVAKDLCMILEQPNISQVMSRLKEYEKGIHNLDTPGGNQDLLCISESGLYRIVLTSRKPQAEPFQDWVCQEVLPSIRKTGQYAITNEPTPKPVLGAYMERVETMFENAHRIPEGYWCVLHEASQLLVYVEGYLKLPVDRADLLDGSIGLAWSKYRDDKEWAGERIKFSYQFPDGRWCNPWCYQWPELVPFRSWLDATYKPQLLPKYLHKKYGVLVKI